jgi:hypothetical protein
VEKEEEAVVAARSRLDGLDDALRLRREAAADHQPWSIGLE